jgi:hypothetical protein
MSLRMFNSLFVEKQEQKPKRQLKRRVPRRPRPINVEAPNEHHDTFKVTFSDKTVRYVRQNEASALAEQVKNPALHQPFKRPKRGEEIETDVHDLPNHELVFGPEVGRRYNTHPEVLRITASDMKEGDKNRARTRVRRELYIEDVLDSFLRSGYVSPTVAESLIIKPVMAMLREQDGHIATLVYSQFQRDKSFFSEAPRGEDLEQITATWPEQPRRNYPRGGWKPIKELFRLLLKELDEDTKAVLAKFTPEKIAGMIVDLLKKYTEDYKVAMGVLAKKGLKAKDLSGKTAEELQKLLGKDIYTLITRVVGNEPERRRLSGIIEAVGAGQKASIF